MDIFHFIYNVDHRYCMHTGWNRLLYKSVSILMSYVDLKQVEQMFFGGMQVRVWALMLCLHSAHIPNCLFNLEGLLGNSHCGNKTVIQWKKHGKHNWLYESFWKLNLHYIFNFLELKLICLIHSWHLKIAQCREQI